MDDLAQQLGLPFLAQPWLPQVFVVFIVVLVANIGAYYVLHHLEKFTRRTAAVWDDALIKAARRPTTLILWVAGVAYALRIVYQHSGAEVPGSLLPARDTLFILAFAWFLLRLIGNAAKSALARSAVSETAVDRTTIDALSKLGRVTVVILAALAVLQTLGFSIAGVLTFGGIGGIAVGFAAKDMLANFFGGLTIYLDRPFVVGEWIRSPDKDIEGTVEYIGWRHTRVRAFNKNPIYVPNALFTTIVVENPTRMTNRRIKETIGSRRRQLPGTQRRKPTRAARQTVPPPPRCSRPNSSIPSPSTPPPPAACTANAPRPTSPAAASPTRPRTPPPAWTPTKNCARATARPGCRRS